ncbi:MAG: O-antigen ligase family protein [Phycisphaerae bacterium]|nr:O-antigen ligase family protein [Phycisphaerae bacterium]
MSDQLPISTVVFLASFVLGCLGAVRYPLVGILTYLMVYFANPKIAWWAQPIAWMEIRYAYVAAVCTAVGVALNWRHLHSQGPPWRRRELLFGLLVLTMYVSMFTGAEPCDVSHVTLDKMTKVLFFVLMMTRIVTDVQSYRALTWTLIAGTFYLAYESYTAGPNSFVDGRLNDLGGPDFDRAPELGVHFVAMLPFIAAVLLSGRGVPTRLFALVCAVLVCNGIVLTRTRSAMTAIIGGMAWGLARTPKPWRGRLIAVGLAGAVGAYALTDAAFWERMATIPKTIEEQSQEERNEGGQVVTAGRIPTWKAAWGMWKANPLGVGIGNFTRLVEDYPPAYFAIDAHNTIVLCFAELGIFGVVAFAAVLASVCLAIRRSKRLVASHPGLRRLSLDAFALESSILVFLIGGMTVSRLYCEMLWCLLAMPICLERALGNELRRLAAAPRQGARSALAVSLNDAPADRRGQRRLGLTPGGLAPAG